MTKNRQTKAVPVAALAGNPNVGKSTLFNAITSTKNAAAANYPFCTIDPNTGVVPVPDKRLDRVGGSGV